MTELIIGLCTCYILISVFYLIGSYRYNGDFYFNPIANFEYWENLNLFGVLFFTLLLNILFAPFALVYWGILIFRFIFTAGRR